MLQYFKELLKHSSVYSIGAIFENAARFLLLPLYTAYLQPEQLGAIALLSITIGILSKLTAPFNSALVRFYYNPAFEKTKKKLVFNLFILCLLKTAFITVLYLLCTDVLLKILFNNSDYKILIYVFSAALFFQPLTGFLKTLVRMKKLSVYYISVSLAQAILPIFIILYLLIIQSWGVNAVAVGTATGAFIGCLAFLPVLIKSSTFNFQYKICLEPLKYSYPLLPSAYSNFLIQSGDRYIIRWKMPIGAVGIYSFAYNLTSAMNFLIVMPLKQSLDPLIMQMEKAPAKQKNFLSRTATIFYTFALFAALGGALFSREGVMLIAQNDAYYEGWCIIPFIGFAQAQHGLGNFVGKGSVMEKKSGTLSMILIISATVNILLNIILIPVIGLIGAALATVISYIVWNSLKIYYSAKFYDLHFELWRLLYLTFLACSLGSFVYFINTGSVSVDLVIKFSIWVSFPIILFLTKFLKEDEIYQLKQIFSAVRGKIFK